MTEPERIQALNRRDVRPGAYVLYWMQASQRAAANHALTYAVQRANELKLPVAVYFGLTDRYPEANARHYRFLLEGLRETAAALRQRGIGFVVRREAPERGVIDLAKEAALLVCDRGYLRHQRAWRQEVTETVRCATVQVETDAVVPVEAVSPKEEYSAATLRRKMTPLLPKFLVLPDEEAARVDARGLEGIELEDIDGVMAGLDIDRTVPAADSTGGTAAALRRLDEFVNNRLDDYAEVRNRPGAGGQSGLSPYLHFGQISPITIAERVRRAKSAGEAAFLEELIVRRELAMNFVFYNPRYDDIDCLPDWAARTLDVHKSDTREYDYSPEALEAAQTHDEAWNAAQREMVRTGTMHGYMRMYWGKKLLEWAPEPQEAYRRALYLNNKYELDGRDPNGYAGVAWCFGKHDRPWQTRPVYGSVRYMNAAGLARKFDLSGYLSAFPPADR